jgi:hypothetical protein
MEIWPTNSYEDSGVEDDSIPICCLFGSCNPVFLETINEYLSTKRAERSFAAYSPISLELLNLLLGRTVTLSVNIQRIYRSKLTFDTRQC